MKYLQNEIKISGWEWVKGAWVFLNAVFDHAAPLLSEYGLHQKSLVLLALLDKEDTPQGLAHLLRSPASSVSHLLKEVEEKGLITRAVDARDKRRFRLTRTAEGDKALQTGIEAINRAIEEKFGQLEPSQQETLSQALPLLITLAVLPEEREDAACIIGSG